MAETAEYRAQGPIGCPNPVCSRFTFHHLKGGQHCIMHAVTNQIKIMRRQVSPGTRRDWSRVWFVRLSINLETSHQASTNSGVECRRKRAGGVECSCGGLQGGDCFRSVHVRFLPPFQGTEH